MMLMMMGHFSVRSSCKHFSDEHTSRCHGSLLYRPIHSRSIHCEPKKLCPFVSNNFVKRGSILIILTVVTTNSAHKCGIEFATSPKYVAALCV